MAASLLVSALSMLALVPSQPAQTVVHGDEDPEAPAARTFTGSSWGNAQELAGLDAVITGTRCRPSPNEDLLALLCVDVEGALHLRFRSDGAWGGDSTIESSIGGADAELADACFEQRSGEMLVAYRDGASEDIIYRTYDGTLYGPILVDLGLPDPPVAVRLASQPGSDRIVLVAASPSSLHAAIWDGEQWGDIATLDGSYDASADGFDVTCETNSGMPIVCWASTDESSFHTRRWNGESWTTEASGLQVGGEVTRLVLASDRDAGSNTVLAAVSAKAVWNHGGDRYTLRALLWDGEEWSAAPWLSLNVQAPEFPFGAAWERQGGAAVVAWAEQGGTSVRARRWNGSSLGSVMTVGNTQDPIAEVGVVTSDSSDGRVLVLARAHETGTGGDDYFDYIAYSDSGGVDQSGVSYSGPTGENEPGVDLPPVPVYSSGGPDLDLPSDGFGSGGAGSFGGGGGGHGHGHGGGHGDLDADRTEDSGESGAWSGGSGGSWSGGSESDTVSLDPGSYGDLEVDKETTVRFSTGQYVFESVDAAKEVTFECDTSSGDVIIIVEDGFDADKEFTIENSGPYAVIIHVVDGDFQADKEAEIEAAIVVHSGDIEFAKDAEITGYLLASGDIDFNGSSDVSAPTWNFSSPTYSSGGGTDRLWSVAISLGSPGAITELTPSAGWTEASSLPFALSESVPVRARVRVTRWREEQPE